MTNGGGCLEDAKAQEIGDKFFPNLPEKVRPSQVQLSHTPMKALLDLYRDKQILVRACVRACVRDSPGKFT